MAATEFKVFGNPANPTTAAAADIPFTLSGSNSATSYVDMNAAKQDVAEWLMSHPNVKALFSGHDNFNGVTNWNGQNPTGSLIDPMDANWAGVQLFRVDSPMKGDFSGTSAADKIGDETKLSFQVYTLDTSTGKVTEREFLYNNTADPSTSGAWSAQSATLDLTAAASAVPAWLISPATIQPDGTLKTSFRGIANRLYSVDTATTVTTNRWVSITNILAGTDGAFSLNPPINTNEPARFFRVR